MTDALILEGLRNGSMLVVFTKADGTKREMHATLCEELIPEEKRPKEKPSSTVSSETQRVFDLKLKEWRSFRWDRVQDSYFLPNYSGHTS